MTRRFEKRLRRVSDGVWTDGTETYYLGVAGAIGTADQIIVTDNGDGTFTLSLPQDIDTAADVQFGSLGLGLVAEEIFHSGVAADDNIMILDTFSTTNQDRSCVQLRKSASDVMGTKTAVSTGDWLGILEFKGVGDSLDYNYGAYIKCVQNTLNHGDYVPCELELGVSNNIGTITGTITIDGNTGYVGIGLGFTPCSSLEVADYANYVTLTCTGDSDADGARGSTIVWRGYAAGAGFYDSHSLGSIGISHEGSGSDQKAKLDITLNTGTRDHYTRRKMLRLSSEGEISFISGLNLASNNDEILFHNDEAVFVHPLWEYGVYI